MTILASLVFQIKVQMWNKEQLFIRKESIIGVREQEEVKNEKYCAQGQNVLFIDLTRGDKIWAQLTKIPLAMNSETDKKPVYSITSVWVLGKCVCLHFKNGKFLMPVSIYIYFNEYVFQPHCTFASGRLFSHWSRERKQNKSSIIYSPWTQCYLR